MLWLPYIILGLVTLGFLLPVIPGVSAVASVLFPAQPFLLLAVTFTMLLIVIIRQNKQPMRNTLAQGAISLCSFAAAGYTIAVYSLLADNVGVEIDLLEAAGLSDQEPETEVLTSSFTYGQFGDEPLELVVYRPERFSDAPLSPVLIYVHGGGWISGSANMRANDMRWFASQGFVVFSVGYSLSSEQRHLWEVTQQQIGCALRWIGGHAREFKADASRTVMFGESSGGNLAINSAYDARAGRLPGNDCPGAIPNIGAVVSLYPVVDVADFHDNPDLALGSFSRRMAGSYTGGSPRQWPDRFSYVSTVGRISEFAPPTLLFVGEADHIVPIGPAYTLVDQLKALGVDATLIDVPHAEHAFGMMHGSMLNQLVLQASLNFYRQNGIQPSHSSSEN